MVRQAHHRSVRQPFGGAQGRAQKVVTICDHLGLLGGGWGVMSCRLDITICDFKLGEDR